MAEETSKLARTLTAKDLVLYGLIFMIPVAPIAFYVDQAGGTNGMVSLAYLIGALAMLFTGFSYAAMSKRYPFAGSVYNYVQKGLEKPGVGFIAGWAMVLDYILLPTVTNLVGSAYANSLVPAVPMWAWCIIFTAIITVVNLLGIKFLSRLSNLFFVLEMIVVVWLAIAVIYEVAIGRAHFSTLSFYNPQNFSASAVVAATGLVVLSFLGFDAVSTLAEEVKEPRKSVGIGVVASIALIGVIFVLETFFVGSIPGNDYTQSPDAVALMSNLTLGGPALSMFTTVILVLAFPLASGEECMNSAARILFSMGRDGVLPHALGKIDSKHHTPAIAVSVIAVLTLVLSLSMDLATVSTLVSFGALVGFMLLNITVIYRLYAKGERGAKSFVAHVVSPLIGFAICAYMFFVGLTPAAWTVGAIWVVIGFVILAVRTHGFHDPVPQIDLDPDAA